MKGQPEAISGYVGMKKKIWDVFLTKKDPIGVKKT